jgi:hypothetical protein
VEVVPPLGEHRHRRLARLRLVVAGHVEHGAAARVRERAEPVELVQHLLARLLVAEDRVAGVEREGGTQQGELAEDLGAHRGKRHARDGRAPVAGDREREAALSGDRPEGARVHGPQRPIAGHYESLSTS